MLCTVLCLLSCPELLRRHVRLNTCEPGEAKAVSCLNLVSRASSDTTSGACVVVASDTAADVSTYWLYTSTGVTGCDLNNLLLSVDNLQGLQFLSETCV